MTDPITAALHELASHQDQITQLDERETGHFTALTEHLAELTNMIATLTPDDADRYQPDPPPPWWKLAAADRAIGTAKSDEAKAKAEDSKQTAAAQVGQLQTQLEAATADAQPKLDAVQATRDAAAADR